jgi:8-oxo-dGTP pyrophosphatase MutT (NUDIX family)
MHQGGESTLDTAVRETEEETGIIVPRDLLRLLQVSQEKRERIRSRYSREMFGVTYALP